MGRYLLKRLLFAVIVLFAVSILVFSAVRVIPGDVCSTVLGSAPDDPRQCDAINKELGLDEPAPVQYLRYMGGVLHGDFGKTLLSKQDVWGQISGRIPLTLELTLLSTMFALLIAIPVGVWSAVRQDKAPDYLLRFVTIASS